MDKQIVTYSYNGILLDNKKEWTTNTQMNLKNGIILWESITISIKISIKKIMLSKRNKAQKSTYCMLFCLYEVLEKTKVIYVEKCQNTYSPRMGGSWLGCGMRELLGELFYFLIGVLVI